MTKRSNNPVPSEKGTKKLKADSDVHKSLVWFRSDIRIIDNKALEQASIFSGTPDGCIALYIVCPSEWERHDWGAVKVDFIKRSLLQLSSELHKNFNIPFQIIEVEKYNQVPAELIKFCKTNDISAVWFNNEPEWDELQRDSAVEKDLEHNSILCRRFQDQCIVEPGLVLTKESKPYSVFTPFKNTWLAHNEANPIKLENEPQSQTSSSKVSIEKVHSSIENIFASLPACFSLDSDFRDRLATLWPAGSQEAHKRLDAFAKLRIRDYHESRNFPYLADGTSALSPYLAIGAISARECLLRAKQENHGKLTSGSEGICTWISELCWRDFYRHILYHFPHVSRGKPFKIISDKIEWLYPKSDPNAAEAYERWCRGLTGFPIVDAAMRQLNTTGWMHNRLRMVVSMFLTKDLLVS
jgi:deoxyribodipyrimidine photo-lyase